MDPKAYQEYVENVTPKVNGWLSFFKAFVSGGVICVIGQILCDGFKSAGLMHTLANNYTTLYAHCSRIMASSGQQVRMGDPIAEVGQTGQATGPHLHFEIMENGVRINPLKYLNGYVLV